MPHESEPTADQPSRCVRPAASWLALPIALGCIAAIFCSTSWLWASHYPFELLTHFQWQYFLASLAALLMLLLLRRKALAILALAAVVVSGLTLLPFSALGRSGLAPSARAAEPSETLRLFHANVLTYNRRADDLLAQINAFSPDVIVLQEVDRWWVDRMKAAHDQYPHRLTDARPDNFGLLVLSRLPLDNAAIAHGEAARMPSAFASITFGGRAVPIATTHPLPPMRAETQAMRDRQLDELINRYAPRAGEPLILIGDLNTTPWSPIYHRLTRTLNLHNAREGRGLFPTWPADLPAVFRIPIDHVLLTSHFEVTHFAVGEEFGSDHLPLLVELRWRTAATIVGD